MKNKAFTLIELLVVVLIIGILAAIAVPQYQKAVTKSRFATLKSMTRSLYEAEKVYYLQNGHWTKNFNDLDLSVMENNISCHIESTYLFCENYYGIGMAYVIGFESGIHYCVDGSGSAGGISTQICKEETGNEAINTYWYPY